MTIKSKGDDLYIMIKIINRLSMALKIAIGLGWNLIILGSLFSEGLRENVMVIIQMSIAHGPWGILILLWFVVGCLDSCWQFNYATYKAKGFNRQWINLIQIKYPYQNKKWLKPICVISAWAIISLWIF
jgi:hypothetical protein